ncbi:dihydroxyacetone kinase DhaL subunit [Austwickia chelonae]|uniref:Dihydroxyacetone kinase nucleotide-binding subunit DhaL n=1 Tax=Austwickia chelonae NBRC 105200 TaxID=1184607 RepID=K6UNQ1_9MICO|nr:dihydroxyacetone kinase subunit DhaL [Austwickia chelonae]GAB79161.1 dihydroxyacetone kinase nucleotide-binding subunit DhaL [Austwickia chelonae NBRC 105200]SEW42816.1 dihydroxyacetone kinase DhaL subunit [Austwickia chelonae]
MTDSALTLQNAHAWMVAFAEAVHTDADLLTDLDRQIGDADHGSNMDRGMQAVTALDHDSFADTPAYLKKAGMTLVSTVGGASGPLYGTFFMRFAGALGDESRPDTDRFAAALQAGVDGVIARGKAEPGDKTMIDALAPAVEAFAKASTDGLAAALTAAADAAAQGRDATTPLVARKGRASYLGERSAGHQDPGATSTAMLLAAAAKAFSA